MIMISECFLDIIVIKFTTFLETLSILIFTLMLITEFNLDACFSLFLFIIYQSSKLIDASNKRFCLLSYPLTIYFILSMHAFLYYLIYNYQ